MAAPAKNRVVNLRASEDVLDRIDRAASIQGRSRSEFILESSRREADAILVDRREIRLDGPTFEDFVAQLAEPLPSREALRALLQTPDPWD